MTAEMDKKPLIEAVAELRWGAAGAMPAQVISGQPFTFGQDASASEDFFMNFGAECAVLGMPRAERVVPHGFPIMPGQVVYRFKSTDKGLHNLLQVGVGVFSANALPPYRSWVEFKEFIALGLDALLASRPAQEKNTEFLHVNLRYINGFDAEYRAGETHHDFLGRLGFSVGKPKALEILLSEANEEIDNISISSRLNEKSSFHINVYEGVKNNMPAQIVELSSIVLNVSPDKEAVLSVFEDAHELIERIFFDMIEGVK